MANNHSATGRIAVRNTLWLTIGSYVVQGISFAAMLVLVRLLTPDIFGFLAIGLFWSNLLNLSPKAGLSFAAIRQPELTAELLGTYYRLERWLAVGTAVLALVAAAILVAVGYDPAVSLVLVVTALLSSATALTSPYGLAIEKEMQFSRATVLWTISTLVGYALGIALAAAGAGLYSLLAMNAVTIVLNMLSSIIVCRWRLPHILRMRWTYNADTARMLIRQGLPVGMSNLASGAIVNQYDNFLIGTYISPTTLGYYDRAYRISQWPNILLTSSLIRVALPTFSRIKDDLPRLTHSVKLAIWLLTTLGVPVALFIFFGAPDIVALLYGPAWSRSAYFLRFLAIFTLLSPYIALIAALATALGHRRVVLGIPVAQAVTLIGLGTPLTWAFGVNGTIAGVGCAVAVGFILSSLYVFRQLPLSAVLVFAAPVAAMLLAALTALWVVTSNWWLELHILARLLSVSLATIALYPVLILVLRPHETIERLRYITRTFRKADTVRGA